MSSNKRQSRQVNITKLIQNHSHKVGGSIDSGEAAEHKVQHFQYTEVFAWGNDSSG
jgi:hypothetical protein